MFMMKFIFGSGANLFSFFSIGRAAIIHLY